MLTANNPAGRLYLLLADARTKPPNTVVRQVWADVFGVSPDSPIDILQSMAQLINLILEAKDAVTQLDDINHDIYLRPLNKIGDAFSKINLETQWDNFRNNIDDATMTSLEFCSDTLSRRVNEEIITDEDLSDILAVAGSLLEVVLDADIDSTLKAILVENIEAIRSATLGYRVSGAKGLRRAVEVSLGSMMWYRDLFERELSDSKKKKTILDYLSLVDKIKTIVDTAMKLKLLTAPVAHFLLGDPSSVELPPSP